MQADQNVLVNLRGGSKSSVRFSGLELGQAALLQLHWRGIIGRRLPLACGHGRLQASYGVLRGY